MMSTKMFRIVFIYLALMGLLAAVGAINQAKHRTQWRLIERKEELQLEVAALRIQAAAITGPLAVQRWAAENGMVAASESREPRYIHPMPAPYMTLTQPTLEIQTIWR
jgi:type II secretory pathway pseudopilin PulG